MPPKTAIKTNSPFSYSLGQTVRIRLSGEVGEITQRCENRGRLPEYRVQVELPYGHSVFRVAGQEDLEPKE